MSAEIRESSKAEVILIGGGGGIFEIRQDGKLIWKKERGGPFPAKGEAAALIS